jgi:hypothetical protein
LIIELAQKSLVRPETQSVIALFLSCCSSCWRIDAATCFSGVTDFGFTGPSGSITNHALYWVGS